MAVGETQSGEHDPRPRGDASDLRLLVPRYEASPDPRFVYTTLDGKLYRFDHWAIRGHDDLGLPFPSEAES